MVVTLALRNLLYDRTRLVGTLIGVVFSTVLVTIQLGLYVSSERMITTLIDHSEADLWIVPRETKSFENAALLPGHERYLALSTKGVVSATEIIVGFGEWRKPSGAKVPIVLIGADVRGGGPVPWNVVQGSSEALHGPDAIAVDRSYLQDLGIAGLGDEAEIGELRARIAVMTSGIRSFTTLPYVFTSLQGAREYVGIDRYRCTYILVRLAARSDIGGLRDALLPKLRDAEVLTTPELRRRTIGHWLFATGAGAALIVGAGLGVLVGTVIVGQSLYASASDHLSAFATLRALGSSAGYIHRIILMQAGLSAVAGYGLGAIVGLAVVWFSADTAMPVVMTPFLAVLIFIIIVIMCAAGATSAIMKVTRIDPATVFQK
jgi:putative ABC transport system permease protein